MFELYQIKQFITICNSGSLSKAAQLLNITQPALTRSVKLLEQELDVELFERKKNRMDLNQNGQFFLKYARELYEMAETSQKRMREFDLKNKTVNIGICAPVIEGTGLISMLHSLYPEISVMTHIDSQKNLISGLKDSTYNLIIINKSYNDDLFVCKPVFSEDLCLVVSETSPFASRDTISLSEIKNMDILLLPKDGYWNEMLKEEIPENHFIRQRKMEDYRIVIENSELISFTPLSEKLPKLHYKGKKIIPLSDSVCHITYHYVASKEFASRYTEIWEKL